MAVAAVAVRYALSASWIVKTAVSLVLFVVMAFAVRILSLKDVKSLVE